MQPTRDSLIGALLQAKLWLRRLHRRWRRDAAPLKGKPLPSSHDALLDDGSSACLDADLSTSSKSRRYHPAALPARPVDPEPIPPRLTVVALFLASLLVRVWGISFPDSVVFDEVHFLRFIRGYYFGEYLFDIHPPLGKLILLLVTKLFCGPPKLEYEMNGEPFGDQIYAPLRWTSALFGSAVPPITYLICRELGLSVPASLVPTIAQVFEHLAVIESRLVLLDGQLMFFMSLCLLCALRLWGARKDTRPRLAYLVATALSGAAAISVKWTSLATPALVALVSLFGRPFPRQGRLRFKEMVTAAILALSLYTSCFYLHFKLLPKSGRGDGFMGMNFQKTLVGGQYYQKGYEGPGFLRNFLYLNWKMYTANAHIKTRHHWESKWYQWMINQRGLLYFSELDEESSKPQRIYLIVNPAVTVISLLSLLVFLIIAIVSYLPRRRSRRMPPNSRIHAFAARGTFLFIGYVVNILPYVGKLAFSCNILECGS